MSIIVSENFDGVTAPAIPAGWTVAAGYQTETTAFQSSPNGITNTTQGNSGLAYYGTDDGNGGDARASATFWSPTLGAGGNNGRVFCRMTTPSTSLSGVTGIASTIDFASSVFALQKYVAGTPTTLHASVGFTPSTGEKYTLYCETVSSGVILRCQRSSDGKWIDSSGTWQTGIQDCISVTGVSSAIANGYGGFSVFRQFIPSSLTYADDFLFETIGAVVVARRRVAMSLID